MNKKNMLVLAILAMLVAIYFLGQRDKNTEETFTYFSADSTSTYSVELATSENRIVLSNVEGTWMLTEPVEAKVKSSKIEALLDKLFAVKSSTLPVSESEASFEKYNITDSLATSIKLFDQNKKLLDEALIGEADNYNFSYGRDPKSNMIYQLSQNLAWAIKPELASWRENVMLKLDSNNITEFEVYSPERSYKLTYSDSLWAYTEADVNVSVSDSSAKLKTVLKQFSNLKVNDFIDNDFATYAEMFKTPLMAVKVNSSIKGEFTLNFIKYDGATDIMQINNEEKTLYKVKSNLRENFSTSLEDYLQ